MKLVANTTDWRKSPAILDLMHPASFKVWSLYNYNVGEKVQHILKHPIIGTDGDLTATRDYSVYVKQMDDIAALKYKETAPYLAFIRHRYHELVRGGVWINRDVVGSENREI